MAKSAKFPVAGKPSKIIGIISLPLANLELNWRQENRQKFYFFRFGLLADFLAGFEADIGGAAINRFIASSKLIPCRRRSMALGMGAILL